MSIKCTVLFLLGPSWGLKSLVEPLLKAPPEDHTESRFWSIKPIFPHLTSHEMSHTCSPVDRAQFDESTCENKSLAMTNPYFKRKKKHFKCILLWWVWVKLSFKVDVKTWTLEKEEWKPDDASKLGGSPISSYSPPACFSARKHVDRVRSRKSLIGRMSTNCCRANQQN